MENENKYNNSTPSSQLDESYENESDSNGKKGRGRQFWLGLSVISVTVFIIIGFITYAVITDYYQPEQKNRLELLSQKLALRNKNKVNKNLVRRLIDGVYVEPGEENLFPIAVVIDNHPDARPPAGLAEAQLVYEAPVEGVTTRFLAFYTGNQEVPQIGPVRSARPYFIDWVSEFSACFSHCGGSPEALVRIAQDNILDLNEFFKGEYFWRASNRIAPHNVMTSYANLRKFTDSKDENAGEYFSWQFKEDKPIDNGNSTSSTITIENFEVSWQYDKDKNLYQRFLAGQEHKDADGLQISAKNVVLLVTELEVIDELLRLKIRTLGEGDAAVCQDGACYPGTWRKNNLSARTRFYDQAGKEFKFNAGTTWVEVVGKEYNVVY